MKAPVSRRRGKWPMPSPVIMDLLGMGQDGTLYLWQAAAKVQPMDRFATTPDKRIVSGHYVLEMRCKAVACYVGNGLKPGDLVVQVMCRGAGQVAMPMRFFEGDVLGRVIPDPKAEAEINDTLRRMREETLARQTALHRKRGRA